ncbi:MAG TPA: hypothetical protein VHR88_01235 [Solirubrobacteraceae bacterium]|jgi:hypothetical protein|nr:hypothetical protein [Solirubrobacteraceae bacterium]
MRRFAVPFLAAALLAGCGTDHGIGDGSYDPRDSRIACLAKQGLPAHKAGASDVLVTPAGSPPLRIYFASTPGEAEALAVEGRASGAEQLGRSLLYVGRASEPLLTKIEGCLGDN